MGSLELLGDGRVIGHPLGMLILPLPCWVHEGERRGRKEESREIWRKGGGEEVGRKGGRERGKQLIYYIRGTQLTNQPQVYSEHFPASLPPFSASVPSNQRCPSFQESPPPAHCRSHKAYTRAKVVVWQVSMPSNPHHCPPIPKYFELREKRWKVRGCSGCSSAIQWPHWSGSYRRI